MGQLIKQDGCQELSSFYGALYYDPVLGRFISPDNSDAVIDTNPQTLNRYAYVGNN